MSIKKQIIELAPLSTYQLLKEELVEKGKQESTIDFSQVVNSVNHIINKMNQSKMSELQPPFFPKTLTKFRNESFYAIKPVVQHALIQSDQEKFMNGLSILKNFIVSIDCQYLDIYLQQIREPYVRKIFEQNYQFDKIDFKEINNEYKIRTQTDDLLNSASEWLIQIERTQDLLDRLEIYFDIKTPMIIEKAKKGGTDLGGKKTWGQSFFSAFRNISSYALRKSSKIIQSSFFTTIAPTAAMLTMAIIGGTTIPFSPAQNSKLLLGPIIAITVPYFLDGIASTIQRKQYLALLQQWTIAFEQIARNIVRFNQQVQETIFRCIRSRNWNEYAKQKLNLQKLVKNLTLNISNLGELNESDFQQIRERSQAYFRKYNQICEGQWTIIVPQQQQAENNNNK